MVIRVRRRLLEAARALAERDADAARRRQPGGLSRRSGGAFLPEGRRLARSNRRELRKASSSIPSSTRPSPG